jgi:hypothetical protein
MLPFVPHPPYKYLEPLFRADVDEERIAVSPISGIFNGAKVATNGLRVKFRA